MIQSEIFKTVPVHRFSLLTKEEQIQLFDLQQKTIEKILLDNSRLRAQNNALEEKALFVDEQLINIKNKLFGKSSEREPSESDKRKARSRGKKNKKKKVQLPSLRYPNAP